MASSMFVVGVTLKAFDQMSGVLGQAQRNLTGLQKKLEGVRASAEKFGRAGLADGLIAGAGLQKTVSAFAELEDASTRLKATMMDKNGVTGAFEQVNALAVELGNRLPGTSADFLNMMAALKAQGISDASILGGVGAAAANLGVLLKLSSGDAATFAAKMKVATGTADKDMLGLMDTIQRLNFMGVTSTEMMYAFARSAGALKVFKIQGLEASRALAPVFAMLIKGGLSGETVGTGFAALLNNFADKNKLGKANRLLATVGLNLSLFDKTGNLKPVRELVAEFDKLKNLDPLKLNAVLKELTGGGQDQQMLAQLITNGLEGYDKAVADMEKQADLTRRVNEQLRTLANIWDAASGTFINALAAFAETFAPELKTLTEWFGKLSEGIFNFARSHPLLSKWIGLAVTGFVAVALTLGGVAIALAGVLRYAALVGPTVLFAVGALSSLLSVVSAVGAFMLANPISIAIAALAIAALAIYENWEPIKAFFIDLWGGVKKTFTDTWEWITSKINAVKNALPDWLFGAGGGSQSGFAPARSPMAPALPIVPRSAASVDVGGRTDIYIHEDRVTVKSTPNDKRVALNVYNGPSMMAAN